MLLNIFFVKINIIFLFKVLKALRALTNTFSTKDELDVDVVSEKIQIV